jgi:hypothetical protein
MAILLSTRAAHKSVGGSFPHPLFDRLVNQDLGGSTKFWRAGQRPTNRHEYRGGTHKSVTQDVALLRAGSQPVQITKLVPLRSIYTMEPNDDALL